jgi:hypothetical protein
VPTVCEVYSTSQLIRQKECNDQNEQLVQSDSKCVWSIPLTETALSAMIWHSWADCHIVCKKNGISKQLFAFISPSYFFKPPSLWFGASTHNVPPPAPIPVAFTHRLVAGFITESLPTRFVFLFCLWFVLVSFLPCLPYLHYLHYLPCLRLLSWFPYLFGNVVLCTNQLICLVIPRNNATVT